MQSLGQAGVLLRKAVGKAWGGAVPRPRPAEFVLGWQNRVTGLKAC